MLEKTCTRQHTGVNCNSAVKVHVSVGRNFADVSKGVQLHVTLPASALVEL